MTRPAFTHSVFEQLYTRDYFIADEVLRDILALGPDVAVPELLKITDTTLADFAAGKLWTSHWLDRYYFYHALYLLHDLHAPEAFDVYRHLLRLDSESTEFWFGDGLFEEVPELLAHAAETRLPELLALLDDPQLTLQHRLVASGAVARLAREQPTQRPAIVAFMQQYLRRLIDHPEQAQQLLPPDEGTYAYQAEDYLGLVLADLQEAGLRELAPEMRELHGLGLVDESISGGETDINFDQARPLLPVPDIFARYQELRDDPESDSPHHPDAPNIARRRAAEEARLTQLQAEYYTRPQPPQPRVAPPKVGRNDPCYCGSGKKYKKCHGA